MIQYMRKKSIKANQSFEMHLEDRAREFVGKVMQCVKYMDVDMDVYFTTSNNIISQISDIFLHTLFTRKEESAKKAQAYISLFVVVSHFVHSRYTLKRKMIIWLTKCNVHIVRKKSFYIAHTGKEALFFYTHTDIITHSETTFHTY